MKTSPKGKKPKTFNFTLRLTADERHRLRERAGRVPLGTYIRDLILTKDHQAARRRSYSPLKDQTAYARVLAALGQSRLSNNLNQLAKLAHIGALPMTPETESEIVDACTDVAAMRRDLMMALGLKDGTGS